MSESEGKMRTRSQASSKKGSRDSSRERPKSSKSQDDAQSSRAVVSASDREKIKGILKTERKEPSEAGYSSAAESSAIDSESDGGYQTVDDEAKEQGGGNSLYS